MKRRPSTRRHGGKRHASRVPSRYQLFVETAAGVPSRFMILVDGLTLVDMPVSEAADLTAFYRPAAVESQHLLEMAWGLIANVGNGDWSTQSRTWRAAARRWEKRWSRSIGCGR